MTIEQHTTPTGGTFTFTYHDGSGHSGTSDPAPYDTDDPTFYFEQAIQRCRDISS